MSYFPMFVELKAAPCLIVGGGIVAYRKVQVLLDYGAEVTVIAPEIDERIRATANVRCVERCFVGEDAAGAYLVVAATDDKELNHRIAESCHRQRIPVNAVDQIEDCSFIFPSYVKEGEVVAAFSSGGKSPVITQYLKGKAKEFVTAKLGELADILGELRPKVKREIHTEQKRKLVYQELLERGLDKTERLSQEEIDTVIEKYRMDTKGEA